MVSPGKTQIRFKAKGQKERGNRRRKCPSVQEWVNKGVNWRDLCSVFNQGVREVMRWVDLIVVPHGTWVQRWQRQVLKAQDVGLLKVCGALPLQVLSAARSARSIRPQPAWGKTWKRLENESLGSESQAHLCVAQMVDPGKCVLGCSSDIWSARVGPFITLADERPRFRKVWIRGQVTFQRTEKQPVQGQAKVVWAPQSGVGLGNEVMERGVFNSSWGENFVDFHPFLLSLVRNTLLWFLNACFFLFLFLLASCV